MNSNLPLLFANGFPTSFNKITQSQLYNFLPFMINCSLGHDTSKEISVPIWWKQHFPPLEKIMKPSHEESIMESTLKSILLDCYRHHENMYLLHFCNQLSNHPIKRLCFVDNDNGTTSLYLKNGGLLCTLRNENMNYDNKIDIYKKSLIRARSISNISLDSDDEIVSTINVALYLCDKCDTKLDSLSALKDHEKICNIVTMTPYPNQLEQTDFMNYFKLRSSSGNISVKTDLQTSKLPSSRRKYHHFSFKRCQGVPFSSPAGIFLAKQSSIDDEIYLDVKKRKRIEKLCYAPPLCIERPTWLDNPVMPKKTRVSFTKTTEVWTHTYSCYRKKLFKYLKFKKPLDYSEEKVSSEIVSVSTSELQSNSLTLPVSSALPKKCLAIENSVGALQKSFIDLCESSDDEMPDFFALFQPHTISTNNNQKEYIDLCSSDDEGIIPDSIIRII